MNFLPIIILIIFMFKNNNGVSELLQYINFDDLAPILPLLGVDESIIETFKSDDFKEVLKGNLNVKTLLPLLMPLLTAIKQPKSESQCFTSCETLGDLTPIKDIAGQNVTAALEEYFS